MHNVGDRAVDIRPKFITMVVKFLCSKYISTSSISGLGLKSFSFPGNSFSFPFFLKTIHSDSLYYTEVMHEYI